jgi:hypothetical protein
MTRLATTRLAALKELTEQYKQFDEATRARGFVQLFEVTACEVCGAELCAPNGVGLGASQEELEAVGLTNRKRPDDEGGYSEIHEAATCSPCCYDVSATRPLSSSSR